MVCITTEDRGRLIALCVGGGGSKFKREWSPGFVNLLEDTRVKY